MPESEEVKTAIHLTIRRVEVRGKWMRIYFINQADWFVVKGYMFWEAVNQQLNEEYIYNNGVFGLMSEWSVDEDGDQKLLKIYI